MIPKLLIGINKQKKNDLQFHGKISNTIAQTKARISPLKVAAKTAIMYSMGPPVR